MPPNIETELNDTVSPAEPVLQITLYERVVSLLLSVLVTAGTLTAALGTIWWASRPAQRPGESTPIGTILVDLGEDWGGVAGGSDSDSWDVPGIDSPEPTLGVVISNSDSEFDPQQATASVLNSELHREVTSVLDGVQDAVKNSDRLWIDSDGASSGLAWGRRGRDSRSPNGDGVGRSRGVPLNRRWEIKFASGLTIDEYARQLDFLRVELGVIVDGRLYRVSQHVSSRPLLREADLAAARKELFFIWRDESRRQVDLSLVRRSALPSVPDDAVVMHFYPVPTIQQLGELERAHAASHGRSTLRDVAKTRFTVQRSDNGYQFEITQQTYGASSAP